jgi:hypothetical protein
MNIYFFLFVSFLTLSLKKTGVINIVSNRRKDGSDCWNSCIIYPVNNMTNSYKIDFVLWIAGSESILKRKRR